MTEAGSHFPIERRFRPPVQHEYTVRAASECLERSQKYRTVLVFPTTNRDWFTSNTKGQLEQSWRSHAIKPPSAATACVVKSFLPSFPEIFKMYAASATST